MCVYVCVFVCVPTAVFIFNLSTHTSGLMFTVQLNELQPPEASAMDPEILDSHLISMLHHCGHFVACPGTSVHHGNQQEVTDDKWMLKIFMSDGNHPNTSDFMV